MYQLEREERLDLKDIPDIRLKRVHDYWQDLCGKRKMPARSEIDPLSIWPALGRVNLIDVEAAGSSSNNQKRQYRHRLFGSLMGVIEGKDFTGKTLQDLPYPQYRELLNRHYDEIVEQRLPSYYIIKGVLDNKRYSYDRLALPLSDDGENVTGIMIASFPHLLD
ncbi:PAS domain-containing protein [Kiloniella laminariae]|uniref:PAS domain-containing protein n=1 Tax=Kiloniella laminariae TaxID=454162 RepID=A0ABT4LHF5_9PROT|nr:PAS domain-containing protein [Kiloniella laminariae]MCZ4279447.1 PAS domain-containing protein [Kiloniella laminariae]